MRVRSFTDQLHAARIRLERNATRRDAGLVLLVALGHPNTGRYIGASLWHQAGVWRGQFDRLPVVRCDAARRVSGLSMVD